LVCLRRAQSDKVMLKINFDHRVGDELHISMRLLRVSA